METPADNSRYPQTGAESRYPQTGAESRYPQTGAESRYPQTGAESRHPRTGAERRPGGSRRAATQGNSRAMVLGSLTIPGRPEQVGLARAFVSRTLGTNQVGADADAATLLTSEIVTNAIQHTKSGVDGGTVTIVVIGVSRGVLVEIIDDGSAGTPVVKGDLYAAEGHGLFLVQHLASQWGYLRDGAGTTVWFHLPAAFEPQQAAGPPGPSGPSGPPGRPGPAGPSAGRDLEIPAQGGDLTTGSEPYRTRPTHLWAVAIPPAATPA